MVCNGAHMGSMFMMLSVAVLLGLRLLLFAGREKSRERANGDEERQKGGERES